MHKYKVSRPRPSSSFLAGCYLTRFDKKWQDQDSTRNEEKWRDLTKDNIWREMTIFNEKWQDMTRFDEIFTWNDEKWQYLTRNDERMRNERDLTRNDKKWLVCHNNIGYFPLSSSLKWGKNVIISVY